MTVNRTGGVRCDLYDGQKYKETATLAKRTGDGNKRKSIRL